MQSAGRSPKRRRLTPDAGMDYEGSSSPDPLTTSTTPFDPAKKSYTVLSKTSTPTTATAGGAASSRRFSYAIEDDSPDELEANNVHEFYRGRRQHSGGGSVSLKGTPLAGKTKTRQAIDTRRAGSSGARRRGGGSIDSREDTAGKEDMEDDVRDSEGEERVPRKPGFRTRREYSAMDENEDQEEVKTQGRGYSHELRGNSDDDEEEEDDDEDQSMHTPRSRLSTGTPESATSDEKAATPPPPPELTPLQKWRPWRLRSELKGHRRGVAQVKISPDGRKIASCSADATIKIWEVPAARVEADAGAGQLLHTMQGHLAGVSTIAWSPDSETLASGSDDKSIRLWNTETGRPYATPLVGHHNYVYSIAFSPKGNMLVSGSYDEAVFLWDVRGARVMRSLPAHSDPVGGVDFVHDGTLIVSCAGDGLIRIWDTATGQCLRTLVQEDREPVTAVRFSPNGRYVLAWTLDSCLRLWDYVDGRCLKTYQGHDNVKYSIGGVFGVYGNLNIEGGGDRREGETGGGGSKKDVFIASGSEDGRVVFWDITTKEVLQSLDAHDGVVLGVDDLLGKGLLVTGGIDGTVKVWELAEREESEDGEGEDKTGRMIIDDEKDNGIDGGADRDNNDDDDDDDDDEEMDGVVTPLENRLDESQ